MAPFSDFFAVFLGVIEFSLEVLHVLGHVGETLLVYLLLTNQLSVQLFLGLCFEVGYEFVLQVFILLILLLPQLAVLLDDLDSIFELFDVALLVARGFLGHG